MNNLIIDLIPNNFKNYKIKKLQSGASFRNYYRLSHDDKTFIFMDSSKEPVEFRDFLKVHQMLSSIDVSVPNIFEINKKNSTALIEDFGDLRFDKIINQYPIKNLIDLAVNSLLIIQNNIKFNNGYEMQKYSYNILKKEISEFIEYFYPYIFNQKIHPDLKEEFYNAWEEHYNLIKFNFETFAHKDYNLNNLVYLPHRNKHKQCGILDFQSAFWGESCWDLFSLLEDSRIYFSDEYNEYFIKLFHNNISTRDKLDEFRYKYNILNCSRQTRLLGRWVKLSNNLNQKYYLDFIKITNLRLIKSLRQKGLNKLKLVYKTIIPSLYD